MNTQPSRPGQDPGPSAGPAGSPQPLPAAEFFDRLRSLGVVRPDEGRWAAGVCAGLARRWALDPLLVRGLFVVGGLLTGVGLGIYGLLWMFLPHPDGRIHAQQVMRGIVTAGFIGSLAAVLVDFPLSSGAWFGGWDHGLLSNLVPVALVGLGVWWLVTRDRRRPPGAGPGGPRSGPDGTPAAAPPAGPGTDVPSYGTPGPERPAGGPETEARVSAPAYGMPHPHGPGSGPGPAGFPSGGGVTTAPAPVFVPPLRRVDVQRPLHSLTLATLGLAGLAGGGVLVWDRAIGRVPQSASLVAFAVALGVIALGIVTAGALGRRPGFLAPTAILLAIISVNGAVWHNSVHTVGRDVAWTPVSAAAIGKGYNLGAGRAVLSLTDPALAATATAASPVTVPASLGVGELVIVVPAGTTTLVDASVGLGNLTDDLTGTGGKDGQGGAGLAQTQTFGTGDPVIKVHASVGLGRIWIVPQGTKVTR